MKQFIITFLFLCTFSVHLSAQDSDPCYVLSVVLDEVDKAVVQGNYDDALSMLENVKKRTDMRNCDKMKDGIVDYKINDVNEKIAKRDASLTIYRNCPDGNHPHLIDLGLPSGTKWACCNVDAKNPEDAGGYYAWGETATKSEYSWSTYKHCDGTKESCHNLGKSISGTQYDVAHVKWGGSWQLPTEYQVQELLDNCKKGFWTTQNGVYGRKFISKNNGAGIFFPAAGRREGAYLNENGKDVYYWSGTQFTSGRRYAYYLGNTGQFGFSREFGFTVRPVAK